MRTIWMTALVGSAVVVGSLLAQTPAAPAKGAVIEHRKKVQQKRIAQGVSSGQLTPAETARLERKEAHVNREVARDRARNGGNLTNRQKAQVTRQQNRISRDIARQKHDAQQVPK